MSEKVASVQGGELQESLARWTENKKEMLCGSRLLHVTVCILIGKLGLELYLLQTCIKCCPPSLQ